MEATLTIGYGFGKTGARSQGIKQMAEGKEHIIKGGTTMLEIDGY